MKTLTLFLVLLAAPVFSQVNFVVKNRSVIWENVYISEGSQVADYLAKHPRFTITSSSGNIIKGRGTGFKNNCTGVSPDLLKEISFEFEIESSGSKFRVTLLNIRFGGPKVLKAESVLLEDGALKAGEQASADMECLEQFFNRTFTRSQIFRNKS